MVVPCEHCGVELDLADNSFGQTMECYNCKTTFVYDQFVLLRMIRDLKKQLAAKNTASPGPQRVQKIVYRTSTPSQQLSQRSTVVVERDKREASGCLCFLLGVFFNLIGVLIAAIIGGSKGAVRALIGMLLITVPFLILLVINLAANG